MVDSGVYTLDLLFVLYFLLNACERLSQLKNLHYSCENINNFDLRVIRRTFHARLADKPGAVPTDVASTPHVWSLEEKKHTPQASAGIRGVGHI